MLNRIRSARTKAEGSTTADCTSFCPHFGNTVLFAAFSTKESFLFLD